MTISGVQILVRCSGMFLICARRAMINKKRLECKSLVVNNGSMTEFAILGGGCFWCLEATFSNTKGVQNVLTGYAGGDTANPSYREVSAGVSGHAEVVQIEFDPAVIRYEDLLNIFLRFMIPRR